jgi:hypothetical protein
MQVGLLDRLEDWWCTVDPGYKRGQLFIGSVFGRYYSAADAGGHDLQPHVDLLTTAFTITITLPSPDWVPGR